MSFSMKYTILGIPHLWTPPDGDTILETLHRMMAFSGGSRARACDQVWAKFKLYRHGHCIECVKIHDDTSKL